MVNLRLEVKLFMGVGNGFDLDPLVELPIGGIADNKKSQVGEAVGFLEVVEEIYGEVVKAVVESI